MLYILNTPLLFLLSVALARSSGGDYNLTLFNENCYPGDFCLSSKARIYCGSTTGQTVERKMGCFLKPQKPAGSINKGKIFHNAVAYLSSVSGPGSWDCRSRIWRSSHTPRYYDEVFAEDEALHILSNKLVITYGDSISLNIFTGILLAANESALKPGDHRRSDIHTSSYGFNMSHVCCGNCACKRSVSESVAKTVDLIQKYNYSEVVLIMRPSLHINANDTLMAEEVLFLLNALEAIHHDVHITGVWIPLHGSGLNLPNQYLRYQDSHVLRDYDRKVLCKIIAAGRAVYGIYAKRLGCDSWPHHKVQKYRVPLVTFDVYDRVQQAEKSGPCLGVMESGDGVHLSMSLQYSIGQTLLQFMKILNS